MPWRNLHLEIMKDFVQFINNKSSKFILKGGTSLMLYYNLDRFSEDLDFDSTDTKFFVYVNEFVRQYSKKYVGLTYRNAKDTDTVKRALIHYGNIKPLKVEVSYRSKIIDIADYVNINGVNVYNIDTLMVFKTNAFIGRDKIRDLFDVCFIYLNYKLCLDRHTLLNFKNALAYRGLNHFDYIIQTQTDELIDNNVLLQRFLTTWYDIGLT